MTENDNLGDERALLLGKFKKSGIGDFSELEMLKMFLFLIIPRRNVNSAAHSLMKNLGSLKNVLFASVDELEGIEGIGKNAALQLRYIGAVTDYLNRARPSGKKSFKSYDKAAEFFINHFKDKSSEILTLLLLNEKNVQLQVHSFTSNQPNNIAVSNREITGHIMDCDCRKVIIAHNHLDGTAKPSANDLKRTRELGEMFRKIRVGLVDHIIVCKGNALSLRKSGYLEELFVPEEGYLEVRDKRSKK